MKSQNLIISFAFLVLITSHLAGCAHQPYPMHSDSSPGFLYGLLHGFILPFSFIGSLFTEYRIYAFPNSGILYDLGFFIGTTILYSSSSLKNSDSEDEEDIENTNESEDVDENNDDDDLKKPRNRRT